MERTTEELSEMFEKSLYDGDVEKSNEIMDELYRRLRPVPTIKMRTLDERFAEILTNTNPKLIKSAIFFLEHPDENSLDGLINSFKSCIWKKS